MPGDRNAGKWITILKRRTNAIYYKGHRVGTRRADFLVENRIILELKAVINLEDGHLAQAMNYLEAYKKELGLLINFGAKSLEFKRVHNNCLINNSHC
jgi:GxxExxY protein